MAINPFIIIDYLAEARERVTEQFKDKIIFDKYLQILVYDFDEIQEVVRQLMQERSIDTAIGAQLDNIGNIVGQPRELIDTDLISYFAYLDYPNALSFGNLNNSGEGGLYYSLGDPLAGNTLLNDEQYRLFIRAKIIKNNTSITPNQLLEFLTFVLGSSHNNIIETGNANLVVLIGKQLNSFERALLNYISYSNNYASRFIPKPIGVGIKFGEYDYDNHFAFQGAPNAKGYGQLVVTEVDGYGENYGYSYGGIQYNVVGGGKYAALL